MSYTAPWRKDLLPASFRGVPFGVKRADTQVGRRVVVHEYPQRDEAYPEDLGMRPREFAIEAIIIGPDYIPSRDALIAALEKAGPGLLVHPYYGQVTVTLLPPARISETYEEGGLARFYLDFIRAGDNVEPAARQDTQGAVESAADAANQAVADDFAKGYEVAGHPDFVEGSALALARDAMSALDAARRTLVPDLAVLSDYMAAANGVMGAVNSLIRAPAAYAQGVLGMVGALKALAKSPLHALNSYRGLLDYGSKHNPVAASTPSRARQAANQAALDALTRRGALVEASRVASRVTFDSYDQAVAARDDLAARLDDEAAGITPGGMQEVSEPVYRALTALRVALVRDLTARAIDAPRVTSATLPATLPALVAAYKIHGDAGLEGEIISRNRGLVRHPGFVPGGEALEVLAK